MRRFLSMTLRGQEVEIELSPIEPDYSVGIMGWGFEEETITDSQGNLLDWELTDEEQTQICQLLDDVMLHDFDNYPD